MKNRGRNKLFMCFRPVALEEDDLVNPNRKGGSEGPVLTYIAVGGGNREGVVIPKILTSMSEEKLEESADGYVGGDGHRRTKKRFHRSLSRVLKAVLFDTSLATEVRNKKLRKNSFRSNSNLSSKMEKVSNSINKNPSSKESSRSDELLGVDSILSSSLYSSSTIPSSSLSSWCSSSITSNSRPFSEIKGSSRANSVDLKQGYKQSSTTKNARGGYYSSSIGLCWLLVCLLVLIFWGKICAIICTSISLFLAPQRSGGVHLPANEIDLPDIDSEEHKKKVIMEGLLKRNRNRVR
ncbi:unnamed protein product [Ilex paraguariensis]|uniref:Uncharacterized protein n=1 Tax=Ilex paraguariensis TaxID=185542 RepID=A0ABC8SSI2_9AQUA